MLEPVSLKLIRKARTSFPGSILRTPLVELRGAPRGSRIFLKLENLQAIGSFKVRGAAAAMALTPRPKLEQGVYTASAGNMAQGVAYNAQLMGIPCVAVVPEHAPETKLRAIRRLGAEIVSVPFSRWWQTIRDHHYPELRGHFIHPVSDPLVMAGNGTIGLEVLEDLPEVDTILVPYGGGGLSCGIAAALRTLAPEVKIYGCEVNTAAPLAAAWRAGHPVEIDYRASFVDGIGGKSVLGEMWPLARHLLAGSIVVSLEETGAAIRCLLERNSVLAEGAGAVPVAAALGGKAGGSTIVCVVSGGNLDLSRLRELIPANP